MKRIPAVAATRKSLAQTIRTIRRMNPAVARQAIRTMRRDRQEAVNAWHAALEKDDVSVDATLELVFRELFNQIVPQSENDPSSSEDAMTSLIRVVG